MGTNGPWNWRWTVPKTTKMALVRPLMTSVMTTVRNDCAVSACKSHHPLPHNSVYKSSYPLLDRVGGRWRVGLWTDVCHPSHSPVAGIWDKANSPNLACWLVFEQQAVGPTNSFQYHYQGYESHLQNSFCLLLFNFYVSIPFYLLWPWCLMSPKNR